MSMDVTTDRTQHIADLTRQIEAGTYRVDTKKIIDGMTGKAYRDLSELEREVFNRVVSEQNQQARVKMFRAKVKRIAQELKQEEAATGHCPVHNVLYTVRTGNRYDDCLRCARWKAVWSLRLLQTPRTIPMAADGRSIRAE